MITLSNIAIINSYISYRVLLFLSVAFLIIVACKPQSDSTIQPKGWIDISIDNIDLPIHKLATTEQGIWGSDYGDGALYFSSDKGDNWEKNIQLGSEYIEVLQFVDEEHGFVCGDYGYVYRTSDGGTTWEEISPIIENRITERYRNVEGADQEPDGLFSAYYSMKFINLTEGFISGYAINPKIGWKDSQRTLFYHTTDGGNNWTTIEKEDRAELIANIVSKLNPKRQNINGTYYLNPEKTLQLKRTRDQEDLVIINNKTTNLIDTIVLPPCGFERPMLREVVFTDKYNGFIFGGGLDQANQKAIIYKTTDGGMNWILLNTDFPHIHCAIVHDQYLYVSGKENMLKKISVAEFLDLQL